MISVWGFGAKLLDTNRVSHYFPLTFNSDADEVKGDTGARPVPAVPRW